MELGAALQKQQRTEEAYEAFEAATRLAAELPAWGASGFTRQP